MVINIYFNKKEFCEITKNIKSIYIQVLSYV
jgi:hypothetical protein